jgi:hypothetical protein
MFRIAISLAFAVALFAGYVNRVAYGEEVNCAGTITKIAGERVDVKTAANQDEHLLVLPATKITLDGKPAKSTDLEVGQLVKCTCNKDGDTMTCTIIEASSRMN